MFKNDAENHENIQYIMGKDAKTVVAILTVPNNAIVEEMATILIKSTNPLFAVTNLDLNKSMLLKGKYVGKAVCHDDDDFDWEYGKKIARLRALEAYYKDRARVFDKVSTIFDDAAKRMSLAARHNHYSLKHIADFINE